MGRENEERARASLNDDDINLESQKEGRRISNWISQKNRVEQQFEVIKNKPSYSANEVTELTSAAVHLLDGAPTPSAHDQAKSLVKEISAFFDSK